MSESREPSSTAAPTADAVFVERWADFTKAYSIYPPTNARVEGALADMRKHLPKALAAKANVAGGLEVAFFQGGIEVADAPVEIRDGSNVEWLHQRIRKASLAAVTFLPQVEDASILAFTARLLDLYTRSDLDAEFEALWPEVPQGMKLQDQRFAGRFRQEGEVERPGRKIPVSAAPVEVDTTGEQDLVDLLMEDEEIREALASFQGRLEEAAEAGDTMHEVDVLGRLIQQMPPDAMDDRETLLRVTRTALQALESRVAQHSDIQALPDDLSLLQLMFEASQGLLGRFGPTNEEVAVRLREHTQDGAADLPTHQGHAGDEKIQDEAELFWQDVASLPAPFDGALTAATIESRPEQVGVLLHFFTAADQEEAAPLARRGLQQRLPGAGRAEAAVLLPYLRPPQGGPDEAYRRRRDRILEFLHEEKLARLLRECGLLGKETIREHFPRDFGLYLESLDVDVAGDLEELSALAGSLGAARIEAAAEELVEVEAITEPERMERILRTRTPSMLPFLRLLLGRTEKGKRQPLIAALRQLRGDDTAACLLSIVDDPELLPVKYLQSLAGEGVSTTTDAWAQRDLIAGVICRYLYATANRPEKADRRAYAIQCLEHFMTPDARKLLEELLRARRHLVVPREPKAVRQAVRRVLQATKAH